MRLEKQTLEHNQMHFLRHLGIDTSDASMVKIYRKNSDNSVVPWNTVCSDRNGLFVDIDGGREPVSVHFYISESNDYDHTLKQDNVVYTTEDLLGKLPAEINNVDLYIVNSSRQTCISYPSFSDKIADHEYIDGSTLKDAAYNMLLTLAEERQRDTSIEIPVIEKNSFENQTLSHEQMAGLRQLGIDTNDASVVKLFYKDADNSYIDDGKVIPTEQGYKTKEGGNSLDATAYFYAAESDDYAHSLRHKNTVYTAEDLLSKLPVNIKLGEETFHRELSYCSAGEYKLLYQSRSGKKLDGATFSSARLCTLASEALTYLVEMGLWKEENTIANDNIGSLLQQLVAKHDAGLISLHDAALELNKEGWTNFVDEERAEQMLRGWKEYNPHGQEDTVIIRSGNKTLVVGEENAVLTYDNKMQQIPILSDILSSHHASPSDIHSWSSFLNGKAIAVDENTVISLYKGIGEYRVKTFPINLFLTQYVNSKDILIRNFDNGRLEELRFSIIDLKVKDCMLLNLFYHAEYGNREIEDNYCGVNLNQTLNAYNAKDMNQLKERFSDNVPGNDLWGNLVKELNNKGLKPLVEESGRYLDVEAGFVPEDY